jgi:uncharacterized protein
MKHEINLRHLDIQAFAKDSASISGQLAVADLPRLSQDAAASVSDLLVEWQADGAFIEKAGAAPQIWLRLAAHTQLPQRCQRCLTPLITDLLVERQYRFVRDEETAWQEDEDSEEDLLVLTRDFDLLELIEDELIMALPLVPLHEHCESEWSQTQPPEEAAMFEKPNPFAVLAALKKGDVAKGE